MSLYFSIPQPSLWCKISYLSTELVISMLFGFPTSFLAFPPSTLNSCQKDLLNRQTLCHPHFSSLQDSCIIPKGKTTFLKVAGIAVHAGTRLPLTLSLALSVTVCGVFPTLWGCPAHSHLWGFSSVFWSVPETLLALLSLCMPIREAR